MRKENRFDLHLMILSLISSFFISTSLYAEGRPTVGKTRPRVGVPVVKPSKTEVSDTFVSADDVALQKLESEAATQLSVDEPIIETNVAPADSTFVATEKPLFLNDSLSFPYREFPTTSILGEVKVCWTLPERPREGILECPAPKLNNHNRLTFPKLDLELPSNPAETAALFAANLGEIQEKVGTMETCPALPGEFSGEELENVMTDEIEDKDSNELCKKPSNCSTTPMAAGTDQRTKFDKHVVDAANEFGIHPALLKAQLHTETSMNPLTENQGEKRADSNGTLSGWAARYRWGKGLGQFGANNAADYNLDWHKPKPTDAQMKDPAFLATLNTPDENGVYSIWSPKGAILAKAKYLKERLDKQYKIKVRDSEGNPTGHEIRIDTLYKRNQVETARYLAGMYNRGIMPINSIEEHFRQTGKLPRYYGEAWGVQRAEGTPTYASGYQILYGERINRCHVYRIAGLCGEEAQGYFGEYSKDYTQFEDGSWQVATS
jgi:hypothetical protein